MDVYHVVNRSKGGREENLRFITYIPQRMSSDSSISTAADWRLHFSNAQKYLAATNRLIAKRIELVRNGASSSEIVVLAIALSISFEPY